MDIQARQEGKAVRVEAKLTLTTISAQVPQYDFHNTLDVQSVSRVDPGAAQ